MGCNYNENRGEGILTPLPKICMDHSLSRKRGHTQLIDTKVLYQRSSQMNLLEHRVIIELVVQSANDAKERGSILWKLIKVPLMLYDRKLQISGQYYKL